MESRQGESLEPRVLAAHWDELDREWIWAPSTGALRKRTDATPAERIDAARALFTHRAAAYSRGIARLGPLQTKVDTLLKGFEARVAVSARELADTHAAHVDARIVTACLTRIGANEAKALPRRLAAAAEAVEEAAGRERAMQAEYASICATLS